MKEQLNIKENNENKDREQMITKLGSLLHNEWRAPREIKNDQGNNTGRYAERVKVFVKTIEGKEKWFDENKVPEGSEEIKRQDIANTSFEDLDPDWQEENKKAAEVAMGQVFEAVDNGVNLDDDFIEKASSIVHNKWLERNSWVYNKEYGNPDLAKPYQELSEEEKEKDRAQVRKAINIFKN